jgi:hypothetical protein
MLNQLAYRPDGNPGFNAALEAQRSRQLEVGARWRNSSRGLALDIALFRADTENEIGIQTNSGGRSTFANVGRTRRQGAGLDRRIAAQWRAQLAGDTVEHGLPRRLPHVRRCFLRSADGASAGRKPQCGHRAAQRVRRTRMDAVGNRGRPRSARAGQATCQ